MKKCNSIEEYVQGYPLWQQELQLLLHVLDQTELHPEIKWGAPTYTLNGKNVVGVAAFKEHIALWFHQGVFINDENNLLIASNENTKGLRQIRFKNSQEIETQLEAIRGLVQDAIQNQKDGKAIKPASREFDMPDVLQKAFEEDYVLADSFKQLTPFKQKEYKEYIASAKQESTRFSRLQKCLPLIAAGKGLNDKYR